MQNVKNNDGKSNAVDRPTLLAKDLPYILAGEVFRLFNAAPILCIVAIAILMPTCADYLHIIRKECIL